MTDTNFGEHFQYCKVQLKKASEFAADGDLQTACAFITGAQTSLNRAYTAIQEERYRQYLLERTATEGRTDSGL